MHQMENKTQMESVLAKLMGLERQLPSKEPRYGRQRVLSESYLQDIALISQHQKWSFDRFSMDADNRMPERRDSSEDVQSCSSSEEFLERHRMEEDDSLFQKLWLLSSVQKADKEYPKKTKTSSSVRNKGACLGKGERDRVLGREGLRHGSTVTHGVAKQVANELQRSVWHDYLNAVRPVLNTAVVQSNSFLGNMNTSNSKVGNGQCISDSTSITSSVSSKCKNKSFKVHKDWCLEVSCKSEGNLTPRNSTSIGNIQSENDVSCEETPSTLGDLSEFGQSDLFEESLELPLSTEEISPCSDVETLVNKNKECVDSDALSQQVVEDAFMPFHQADNGSPLNQTETSKPHPNSASDMKGSEVKLQQSTTTFFHPEAKRHKSMEVKDTESGHNNNPGTYKEEEIQLMSYLIDVLAESGLQCGDIEMSYESRQQMENPINPFAFDSLEKKYSKQPSWLKSDRKLLFDRIKCALSDILTPYTGINTWRKHKKNKLALVQGKQDMFKQELLSVLANQEKEAKREPSDKAVGIDNDWLELEEDAHIVVTELEEMMIVELMDEIVSTHSH